METHTISIVEAIHNIHSLNNFTNGRKALSIQKVIALRSCIDEDLRRSRIGTCRGKDHSSALIAIIVNLFLVTMVPTTTTTRHRGRVREG